MNTAWVDGTLLALAATLLALMWHWLMPTDRLTIGERGILDRALRLGWIRWDEIDGAYQPSAIDRQGLHLKLKPSRRLARRLRRRDGSFAGGPVDVRLDLAGTGISPAELLQQILTHGRRPTILS